MRIIPIDNSTNPKFVLSFLILKNILMQKVIAGAPIRIVDKITDPPSAPKTNLPPQQNFCTKSKCWLFKDFYKIHNPHTKSNENMMVIMRYIYQVPRSANEVNLILNKYHESILLLFILIAILYPKMYSCPFWLLKAKLPNFWNVAGNI